MPYNRIVKKAIKRYPAARKRWNVYYPAARQLASDVMYLKGLINSEPKYHIVQASNNYDYNGIVQSLSTISQGDGTSDRDGNMVLPRYLTINMSFGGTIAGNTPVVVRMIIFRYWGEATSASATVTPSEVLATIGSQYAPYTHLNDDNTGSKGDRQRRIEVLKSKLVNFDNINMRDCVRKYNIVVNGGNKPKEHIKFSSATTSGPVSGGFYILFISDNATGTNAKFTLESKLTFYDN